MPETKTKWRCQWNTAWAHSFVWIYSPQCAMYITNAQCQRLINFCGWDCDRCQVVSVLKPSKEIVKLVRYWDITVGEKRWTFVFCESSDSFPHTPGVRVAEVFFNMSSIAGLWFFLMPFLRLGLATCYALGSAHLKPFLRVLRRFSPLCSSIVSIVFSTVTFPKCRICRRVQWLCIPPGLAVSWVSQLPDSAIKTVLKLCYGILWPNLDSLNGGSWLANERSLC